MNMPTPENDVVAIGQLSARMQQSVRAIEAACIALNIAPRQRINYVPYFDANQIQQLAEYFAGTRSADVMGNRASCLR